MRLARTHQSHNRSLKLRVGQEGTVLHEGYDGMVVVGFDGGLELWVGRRYLELAEEGNA